MRKLGNSPGRLCDITRRWEGKGCCRDEGPFWGVERRGVSGVERGEEREKGQECCRGRRRMRERGGQMVGRWLTNKRNVTGKE
jgi:hypothetical protein